MNFLRGAGVSIAPISDRSFSLPESVFAFSWLTFCSGSLFVVFCSVAAVLVH